MQIPGLSTYLTVYETTKQHIGLLRIGNLETTSEDGPRALLDHLSSFDHAMCAGFAELLSGFVWTPMENIKQRCQLIGSKKLGSILSDFYTIRSLYKGYWMTLFSFLPYSMVYFACFEKLQRLFPSRPSDRLYQSFTNVLANSAIAATIAAFVSSPLDFLKTRWQLSSVIYSPASKTTEPKSFRRFIYLEGKALVANPSVLLGNGAFRCLWMTPSVALSIGLYETFKSFF